ncbi:MAG: hypothetical protein N2C12_14070, partial [Planctomycetales bacterium]
MTSRWVLVSEIVAKLKVLRGGILMIYRSMLALCCAMALGTALAPSKTDAQQAQGAQGQGAQGQQAFGRK